MATPRAGSFRGALRLAGVVAAKDLRQRLRDRSALITAFIMPLVLAAVIGTALGESSEGYRLRLALVDAEPAADGTFADFTGASWRGNVVEIVPCADRAAAEAALESGGADAALLLGAMPRRGDAAVRPPYTVIANGGNPLAARMAEGLARSYVVRRRHDARDEPALRALSPGGRLRTIDFFACSMSVLFLNFAVLAGARALQVEKDSGAFQRLAASPAPPLAILAGKFGAIILTGLLQIGVLVAATRLLFGTEWGNPLPVALLAIAGVICFAGMMLVIVGLAGNAESGTTFANITIFLLSVVGGQFLPPQGLPDVFDLLSRLTPNGQVFRGFVDLVAAGPRGGLHTIAEPLVVTTCVGVAGIAFGFRRAARAIERAA